MSDDMNFNQTSNLPRSKETPPNDPFMGLFTPRKSLGKIVVDGEGTHGDDIESKVFARTDMDNRKIKNLNEPNNFEEKFKKVKLTMDTFVNKKKSNSSGTKLRKPREKKINKESNASIIGKNSKLLKASAKIYKSNHGFPDLDFLSEFIPKDIKTSEKHPNPSFEPSFDEAVIMKDDILSNSKIQQIVSKKDHQSFEKLVDMFVEPTGDAYGKSPKIHFFDEDKKVKTPDISSNSVPTPKSQCFTQEKDPRCLSPNENMLNNHRYSGIFRRAYSPAIAPSLYTRQNHAPEFSVMPPYNGLLNSNSFISKWQFPFKVRLKLFKRIRIPDEQRAIIDKILLIEGDIRFKFFRTISAVAEILNLPLPSPRASHHLRQLHAVFLKYGGLLSTPINILNSIRRHNPKYYIMYQSYVLPLERTGLYVSIDKKKNRTLQTKNQLIGLMCTGIYDDIFFFFQQIEKIEVPSLLINELLSIFFLSSEILYRKFDYLIPYLFIIVRKIGDKPYKAVLEQMNRTTLYNFQLIVFRAILKFEQTKRNKLALDDEVSECIIEILFKRKSLRMFLETFTDDNYFGNIAGNQVQKAPLRGPIEDEVMIVKFLGLNNIKVQIDEKLIETITNVCKIDPALVLRASRNLGNDSNIISMIYEQISIYLKQTLDSHVSTIKNKIMLNDHQQLEDIIFTYLSHLGLGIKETTEMVSIIEEYLLHLRQKKVYFKKRGSSDLNLILIFLKQYISSILTPLQVFICK